ncbi:hypothetical protein ACROYT_G033332 [Oculina patagonica]
MNAWLENYKDSRILYYQRYVDDTFCVFETEQDAAFYSYINTPATPEHTFHHGEKDKVVNQYVSRAQVRPSDSSRVQQPISSYYFNLPYVGSFSAEAQKRLRTL